MQLRGTGKVASAHITPGKVQRHAGQQRAQQDAQQAARAPEQAGFFEYQPQALARRCAQYRQQCQLRLAPCHGEGQHRIDQVGTGEEGDQRQCRQIHAVGARELADLSAAVRRLAEQKGAGRAAARQLLL